MSSTSEHLGELLLQWRELRQHGQERSPEEICADCPELVEQLKQQIKAIDAMEALLRLDGDDPSAVTADAGPINRGPTPTDAEGTASAPPSHDKIQIPGYELLGVIDRGGMGVVYKARQTQLKRLVALKMILSGLHAGPQQLARFRTEAEAIARLQHPHIVQIYDVGESEGRPYFSMEFVEGGNLAQNLSAFRFPAAESLAGQSSLSKTEFRKEREERTAKIVQLIETLARTIDVAHVRGIVHRDLKPANVLLSPEGSPKITDFGLAKRLDSVSKHTNTGAILGTPSYMAPEQASGKTKEIGPATDVYALGAILYELLTGKPPFQGETSIETLMSAMSEEPVPPSQLVKSIPKNLETICLKCLEKKPHNRYASASALAEDLRRFQHDLPITTRRFLWLRRQGKWFARHRLLTVLLVLCFLAAAIYPVEVYRTRARAQRLAPQVKKILHKYCFECHGMELDHVERNLNVLDHSLLIDPKRRMVVPEDVRRSRLLQRIRDDSMPPQKAEELPRLEPEEQQVLVDWIAGGAPPFPELTPEDFQPEPIETSPLSTAVKSIFADKCRSCHNADEAGGGIKILNHDMLVRTRTVVIPFKPHDSELFGHILYEREPVMPPRDKDGAEQRLPAADIDVIRRWIEEGALPFPRERAERE